MLIKHEHAGRTDHEHGAPPDGELFPEHDAAGRFPTLEEPAWLVEGEPDEMEAPRDSPFRGIWIGVATAAVTFALVFAIPQWLGWYDVGPPTSRDRRDGTPETAISTVTAKPSGAVPSGSTVDAPAPAAAKAVAAKEPAPQPAAPRGGAAKAALPPAPARAAATQAGPVASHAGPAASHDNSTSWVQIAAFKSPDQAGRLAARVKRDGYRAEVRHLPSGSVPWVVWVGAYSSREQAEAAKSALARKGFRDSFVR
jgi:cell division septation protein DedD